MSEIELAAEIEYAMRSAGQRLPGGADLDGARVRATFVSTRWHRRGGCAQATWRTREFAGVARRYHSVTMGSLVLGEPTWTMREMERAGIAALEAGVAEARVGARIGDLEAAYRAVLADHGMGNHCAMRFGVGISAAYPPVWENQITIQLECEDRLGAGMAFYLHASMQAMEPRQGMLLGGSFLMTDAGPERLDKAPIEMVVVER